MSAVPTTARSAAAVPSERATVSILSLVLAVIMTLSFGVVGAIFSIILFGVPLLLAAWLARRPGPWGLLLAGVPAAVLVVWAAVYLVAQLSSMELYDWVFVVGTGGTAVVLLAAVVRAATARG